MSMRSILVPWWGDSTSTAQLDAAFHVARCVEAHVEVMFIRPTLEPGDHAEQRSQPAGDLTARNGARPA